MLLPSFDIYRRGLDSLGELVFAIYQTIYDYNHSRIHSALGMSPVQFAKEIATAHNSGNKVGV